MVSIARIEPLPTSPSNKMSQIECNSPDNVEEDEVAQIQRELVEALDEIDTMKQLDLESNNDDDKRAMKDAPIFEEIPSQLNEPNSLANYFARLNTGLDSMDARLISYGEQFYMINS